MIQDSGRLTGSRESSPSSTGLDPSGFDPERKIFNYSDEQHDNIRRKLHPDCCVDTVCAFCGASDANYQACAGELTGLALDLFAEASCSARNANVRSIGQPTGWAMHDRHARAFDAAARAIAMAPGRAACGDMPVPQDCQARPEGIAR